MTATNANKREHDCATAALIAMLNKKWTVAILELLAAAPTEQRFSQILHNTDGLSSKMLSSTMHELVEDGLVMRRTEQARPPRVHYRLSDLGQSLVKLLEELHRWAELHMPVTDQHRAPDASDLSSMD